MIRNLYVKKMTEALKLLAEDIDLLKARSGQVGDELRTSYEEKLEEARVLEKKAHERIAEIGSAGDAHWGKFKSGVDHSVADLRKLLQTTTEKIKRAASGTR